MLKHLTFDAAATLFALSGSEIAEVNGLLLRSMLGFEVCIMFTTHHTAYRLLDIFIG